MELDTDSLAHTRWNCKYHKMKRIISFFICLIILISFSSCNADNNATSLRSGNYYAVGDYEEMLTPYLWLDTD